MRGLRVPIISSQSSTITIQLNMKLYVALALLFIGAALAQEALEDGQPDCSTELQLNIKNFKNKSDPAKYWVCVELGVPATLTSCPEGTIFVYSRQKCVKPNALNGQKPAIPSVIPQILGNRRAYL